VDRLPKRASGMTSDLDENIVRGGGLAIAWVDSTVCAVNATWPGLRFVPRLVDR